MSEIKISQDLTPIVSGQIINEAFLRTILDTQARILSKLESKNESDVIDELYGIYDNYLDEVLKSHRLRHPELYGDK